jgi:DNA polymerase V
MKPDSLIPEPLSLTKLPLFDFNLPAGFPSPCTDFERPRLNVHDYLVDHETSTFYAQVTTEALVDLGILPKDRAVIDRSLTARAGDIVLAVVDGEFTLRILSVDGDLPVLLAANKKYAPIVITEGMAFEIWGVATGIFRKIQRP